MSSPDFLRAILNILTFLIRFAIAVLATYRIAFEISAHLGPFDVFHRMREHFQALAFDNPEKHLMFLDEFVRCATCWSTIISVPIVALIFKDRILIDQALIYFAVNGAIVWLHFRLLGE